MARRPPLRALICSVLLTLAVAGCGGDQPSAPPLPGTPAADRPARQAGDRPNRQAGDRPARQAANRPVPRTSPLPITPDPAECRPADTTYADFLARVDTLTGTPRAAVSEATPAEAGAEDSQPQAPARDQRPDPALRWELVATMREAVACLNTPNTLAFYTFLTDQLLVESIARGAMPSDPLAVGAGTPAATPTAIPPEQYVTLVAVRNLRLLPDGRIGAFVDMTFPNEGPEVQADYIVFRNEDGRWLIDLIISNLEAQGAAEAATPDQ